MNEIIERLKDKDYVRAFGLMEKILPGSQECFEKVGKNNCVCYYSDNTWGLTAGNIFNKCVTYAIKSGYQPEPEPEFVDVEIKEHSDNKLFIWLGIYDKDTPFELPHYFTHLHCLPSLPNFEGFKFSGGTSTLLLERVASLIHEGKTVYARFRTKE